MQLSSAGCPDPLGSGGDGWSESSHWTASLPGSLALASSGYLYYRVELAAARFVDELAHLILNKTSSQL